MWLALVVGTLAVATFAQPPQSAPAHEAALWEQIVAFDRSRPRVGPQPTRVVLEALRRQLRRLELYRTLFPGGRHIQDALAAELELATEIGIAGGGFDDLYRRVDAWRAQPPAAGVEAEVDYFAILADRLRGRLPAASHPAASAPTSRPGFDPLHPPPAGDALLAAWVRYVQRYPRSRHSPALCEQIFDEARRRGDAALARRVVGLLERSWPGRARTQRLRARLDRWLGP